ncbi:MFS transporter [Lacticaseibacillus yichunensis]|uniref:MFS transporter n=1 Tax=Lacticaseibacillus yichunensis TaxID=2486015 RepID=A0ABW4CPF5_9LACO|nr:MFS transporter [Lacticaseibacillus yichunensis]
MKIKQQLRAATGYSVLAYFGITQLWVIYLAQQGLSLVQIGWCESIFHIASFLFEVPSGVLADRFSYRRMLMVSRIAALLSAAMMLVHGNFWWFALSFVLSAWSYNLQSGTLEALIYESLEEVGCAADYARVNSRMNIWIEVAATGGLLIAGTLATRLQWGYALAIGLSLGALVCVVSMTEPKSRQAGLARETTGSIIKTAAQVLRQQPQLFFLMLFDAAIGAVSSGYYYYFQNVMQTRQFATWLIAALLAGSSLFALLAIWLSPRFAAANQRVVLVGLSVLLGLGLLCSLLNASWVLAALYLLNYALGALIAPLFSVYYNALIPKGQRATLLSVASLLYSLVMIGLFPLLGWLIGLLGFGVTFGGLGALILAGAGLLAVGMRARVHA